MIPLMLTEIADAVGGRLDAADPQARVTGPVVVDSREVRPGGLFVARVGEARDGHDFAAAAVQAGAVAVLAARPVGAPAVVVDDGDTERAFGRLARAVLDRLSDVAVVAVTGSSGKTTTKDLLSQVLAPLGPLIAPPGSYNTEVGVPLTVLRADETTRTLVIEMGARGLGHVRGLCAIAPPAVGVVLNVGSAHLGEFGDRETIGRAKGELVEALPPAAQGGAAVLNADDPVVRRMAERTEARVIMVGESVHADVRAEDVRADAAARASFTLVAPDGKADVSLRLVGAHQVANALAAAGAAHALGMPVSDIAKGLSEAVAKSRHRMEVTERPDGVTVINDAYNANPESMRAALTTLASVGATASGRTWAVLGEMLELGESAAAEHEALGRLAAQLNVDRVVAVGDGARPAHEAASGEASWSGESVAVPDIDAAFELLDRELRPGDVVLVKSSNGSGLRRLGDRLVATP